MEKGYYTKLQKGMIIFLWVLSQSTIKMEKGYYKLVFECPISKKLSQSTIKMEKGYYCIGWFWAALWY